MANTDSIRRLLEREGYTEVYSDLSYPLQGIWVRETDGPPYNCFDVIIAQDLDSACGASGQTLVEAYSTSFGFCDGREDWLSVFSSMDIRSFLPEIAKEDRQIARLILAGELVQYGKADLAGYGQSWWVAVDDRLDEKEAREKWLDNRVWGWGYAAVQRAVENALSACDGLIASSAYHETDVQHALRRNNAQKDS